MGVIRNFRDHKLAVVIVLCLLCVLAFTDLMIPTLTSQIVDVGIQQSGVEHVAVDEMSDDTFQKVCLVLDEQDEALVRESYDQSDTGTWKLNDYGREHQSELDEILALPLILVHSESAYPEANLDEWLSAYNAGNLSKEQVLDMVDKIRDSMGDSTESLLEQQGIAAATSEYEELGYNLSDMQMSFLIRVGLWMLGLAALGAGVNIVVNLIASMTGAKSGRKLSSQLFSRVVSFTEKEIGDFSAASLITRGTNDIQQVQMVSIMLLRMILYAPILAIGGIIMVVLTSAVLGWIIVLAILLVVVVIIVLFRVAFPKFRIVQKLIDRVNLIAREMLSGLPVVRAFDREDYEEKRFDKANTHLMRTQLFTNRVMAFMMPGMMLIMNATSVAIVWFGGLYIDTGVLQTGDLIALITYAMVIIMGFLMLGMLAVVLPRAAVAAGRVDAVINCEPSIQDPAPDKVQELPHFEDERQQKGASIVFDDVTFAYDEGSEPVIDHVSFKAEPGQTVAIVGATGSGKSTILKLLERFQDVNSGAIYLDGVDIRNLKQHTLRSQLGYVPQKAFLFSGTIDTNVAYVDETMGDERVEKALYVAQALDFVNDKEDGVDSPIAQGGTNVSGGQRQRLAIARALATDARCLLFDDSFSALDYKTDSLLREELAQTYGDVTQIIVAQRIATIMYADTILVLADGHVVGQGSHTELLNTCKEYRDIASSQFSEEELGIEGAM
ncbi:MAG: ABC transporter ATP-binding protein/permease [Eggerthellaceae bacterium]|nr:ABC transporter ATP-binding protein/permease [Eggerthellaceae bacterium]